MEDTGMSNNSNILFGAIQGFTNEMDLHQKREASKNNLAILQERATFEHGRKVMEAQREDNDYEAKMREQKIQIKAQANKAFKTESYEALDSFIRGGSVHRLNYFLQDNKDNPITGKYFADVAQFQKINSEDLEDGKFKQYLQASMLDSTGITEAELDMADGKMDGLLDVKAISKAFIKQVNKDGTTSFIDVETLSNVTGYSRWASDISKAKLKKNNLPSAWRTLKLEADALGIPVQELLLQRRKDKNTTGKKRDTEREADALGLTVSEYLQRKEDEKDPAKIKIAKKALTASKYLRDNGYYDMDVNDILKNDKFLGKVHEVELAHELSDADKKVLIELSAISVGAQDAAMLEAGDVGFIDDKINKLLNITTDIGPDGLTARSAYGAFINVVRHDLFGSAQTDGEIEAFVLAYNHLGSGIVPVLSGLRQAMKQTLAKLKTVAHLNHPVIVKRYMGTSSGNMQDAINTINKKIAFYGELSERLKTEELDTDLIDKGLDLVGIETDAGEKRKAKVKLIVDELRAKHGLNSVNKESTKKKAKPSKGSSSSVINNIFNR